MFTGRPIRGRGIVRSTWLLALGVVAAALFSAAGRAQDVATVADGVRVTVQRASAPSLTVSVWPPAGVPATGIAARIGDLDLPVTPVAPWTAGSGSIALLVLVDTSDPGRAAVVRRNAAQIVHLVDAAPGYVRFGLARFDTRFRMLAPVGDNRDAVKAAAKGLAARGATTELYRHTLTAVEEVAKADAARRAVLILSDGRAEDTAYGHADVVNAARAAGVVIYAFGYSRTVGGTRAFQSLIRLAQETGGLFVPAGRDLALPDDFPHRLFAALSAGGTATVDLGPAIRAAREGPQILHISIKRGGLGPAAARLTVTLPPAAIPVRALAFVTAPENRLLVIGAGIVLIACLVLVGRVLQRRAAARRDRRFAEAERAAPQAYLEFLDDSERRIPIGAAALRIGRNADNDVRLNNTSVSAYHAEIQRRRDGTFIVTDLDSLNGVTINDEPVDVGMLTDGDILDLGEIRFRFRLGAERSDTPEAGVGAEAGNVDDAPSGP